MWIFLNDRFVTEQDAKISVFDHGFLYGDGVYETIRSYGKQIFMRDHHLSRLQRSADAIGLTIPIPLNEWPRLLHEAMDRNQLGNAHTDAYLRITVSRGAGDIGLDPALCPTPTVVIMAKTAPSTRSRVVPKRRVTRRSPDETQPAKRTLSADQSHKLLEQHSGET